MIGICFKYDGGYKLLMREQYYELFKAIDIVAYEREVHPNEPDDYNGKPINRVTNADDLPTEPTLVVLSGQDGKEIQGDISLDDYTHPENAIYFFGDDHGDLTQAKIGTRTDYDKVYIPFFGKSLFSNQAMAVVLYDRLKKNG